MWAQKFDTNITLLEGVQTKTTLGALISVASTILILMLVLSELAVYTNVETVNHLTIDSQGPRDSVKIRIHATFNHLTCENIHLDMEATRGDATEDEEDRVVKTPNGGDGCTLKGDIVVAKVGGNFHIATGTLGGSRSPLIQLFGNFPITHGFNGANMSHTIHELSFGEPFPGMTNPLQEVTNIVPTDIGQYQFHIKVLLLQH